MKHSIPHSLGTELASKATKAAFDSYQKKFAKYDPRATWHTDSQATVTFKVKLVSLEGKLEIHDNRVDMDLDVPLVFRVFKDRAIRLIDSEVREWIEKARNGELD